MPRFSPLSLSSTFLFLVVLVSLSLSFTALTNKWASSVL